MTKFTLNGHAVDLRAEGDTPLLWAIRDLAGLIGTKYGCGIGLCGACTMHIDGVAARSCQVSLDDVEGVDVTTIEGLSPDRSHAVQRAWIEHDVPQCGYCQSGMIMAAVALLKDTPDPGDDDIREGLSNICRCGTYDRIRAALHRAAELSRED